MNLVKIGIDFSINKPAMTILYNGQYRFAAWPLRISQKHIELYQKYNVDIFNRDLDELKKKEMTSSELTLTHVVRSLDLARLIIDYIQQFITENVDDDGYKIVIATEGLSFGSSGNATLDLASYKSVLLSKIYQNYSARLLGLFTYPPISLKSIAGCATKDKIKDKNAMIHAFGEEYIDHPFRQAISDGMFMAKANHIKCVDDIVDSYFALKTLMLRESF